MLLAALAGAPLAAAVGAWSSLGPDGGAVGAAPSDAQVVYAGASHGGVFRSADGGITWAAAGRGLLDDRIVALAVDPRHSATVYAAAFTGVFTSGDGGDGWTATSLSFPDDGQDNLVSLALDPTRPGTVYAGQVTADPGRGRMLAFVFRGEGFSLFASRNHGISWSDLSAGVPQPVVPPPQTGGLAAWRIAADRAPGGPLYLAYELSLNTPGPLTAVVTYRSLDGGHGWHVAAVPASSSPRWSSTRRRRRRSTRPARSPPRAPPRGPSNAARSRASTAASPGSAWGSTSSGSSPRRRRPRRCTGSVRPARAPPRSRSIARSTAASPGWWSTRRCRTRFTRS